MNKLVWDEAERIRRLNLDFIDLTSGMFVRPSVRACFLMHNIWTVHVRVLKFQIWIPHEKIADTYFFPSGLCPFPELWPFEKHMGEILSVKYLKNYWS